MTDALRTRDDGIRAIGRRRFEDVVGEEELTLADTARLLFQRLTPGDVIELRALSMGRVHAGYFDDPAKFADAARAIDGRADVYMTINPVNGELLARSNNRLKPSKATASDTDVTRRVSLYIDLDPIRPTDTCSSDGEHYVAIVTAERIRDYLFFELGWPEPAFIFDSGNGAGLIYQIDLPNDAESLAVIERCLSALQLRVLGTGIDIDQKVKNAARIARVPGTLNTKGDNAPELSRFRRRARIIHARLLYDPPLDTVTREQLDALARLAPDDRKPAGEKGKRKGHRVDVDAWLASHQIEVQKTGPWKDGQIWILARCPFSDAHTDGAYIFQFGDGAIGARCHHDSCAGKDWADLRTIVGDDPKPSKSGAKGAALDVLAGVELFHTPDDAEDTYMTLAVDGRTQTVGIARARRLVQYRYFQETGEGLSRATLQDVLDTLHARAQFSDAVHQVYRRIARVGQAIYLDLCDAERRVIEVTGEGWGYLPLDQAPVRFERLKGAQALPSPSRDGDLRSLKKVLNVSEEEAELVTIFLLGVLRGCKPFPILEVSGPDGAAKSWGSRLIARVLDPSSGSERGVIENPRDFRSACRNSFVIVLDNLSHMEDWLSDAICRAAVGGPQAARTLFTDDDEGRLVGAWPFIVNGIPTLARRGDLISRAISVRFNLIDSTKRRSEVDVDREFTTEVWPSMLGALLDAAVQGLAKEPTTRPEQLPRMADLAIWVAAAAGTEVLTTYVDHLRGARSDSLEGNVVAEAILSLEEDFLKRPLSELYAMLARTHGSSSDWPRTAKGLRSVLSRVEAALADVEGVTIERGKTNGSRWISLKGLTARGQHAAAEPQQFGFEVGQPEF
jgi:hypothetical protein